MGMYVNVATQYVYITHCGLVILSYILVNIGEGNSFFAG